VAVPQATLDRNFALIEAAASKGDRCPQAKPFGPLDAAAPAALARAGRIRIEVFMHNFRVVTMMDGPHKGKQTQAAPKQGSGKPYKIIYKDHIMVRRRA
jgi:hypothetical protein